MLLFQKNLLRSSVDLLGPYDFCNAENMDKIMKFSNKNGIYFYNVECHGIWQDLDEKIKSRTVHLSRGHT